MTTTTRQWIKKGLVFPPDQNLPWMQTHAQLPTADRVEGNNYRVYFASRDGQKRSSIDYVEIDISDPKKITKVCDNPVLGKGECGCFDQHGVLSGSIVTLNEKKYLFYTGWDRGELDKFNYEIGLAVMENE